MFQVCIFPGAKGSSILLPLSTIPKITPFGCTILGCSRLRLFQPRQQSSRAAADCSVLQPRQQSEANGDRVCYFWAVAQPNRCVGQPNGCCAQAEAAQQPRVAKSSTAEQSKCMFVLESDWKVETWKG